jgi:hypothetical protein
MTAYGYPFEMYHTQALEQAGMPDYWLRAKAGTMPGYFSKILIIPEIKFGRFPFIYVYISVVCNHQELGMS